MKSLKISSPKELPRLLGMPFAPGVALLYLLFAGLWIYYSDLLAEMLTTTEEQLRILSTYKGWGFVVLTAALLFLVLNRFVSRIRLAQQCLREHDENLRITLESIGDAVISTGMDGKIVSLNPVAEELTGWSQTDAVGQPLEAVFKIINEHTRLPVENPVTKVLAAGTVVGLANHTLLLARDGREIPIADSGAPIKNESGKITGVVLVFRDQTEERRAQRLLRVRVTLLEYAATHTVEELLTKTLDEAESLVNSPIGFYHFVDNDQQTLSLQAWSTRTRKEFCRA